MTGTAKEVAGELWANYRLRVAVVPTNKPMRRHLLPVRWFATAEEKWLRVVETIVQVHEKGRPVLVGTRSVESSEHLSGLLTAVDLPHRVLNARQDREEADIVAKAGERGRITVATNMAGRGTDIELGDGVAALGGLYVVATELHDARRIDRQLYGRCGRQGDPGTVETFVSLEDELFAVHVGPFALWMASVAARLPLGWLSRWFGAMAAHRAQLTAERQHARMRGDLLRMDDQISDSLAFTGRSE
jgi:preprotein translocase subunit SecA